MICKLARYSEKLFYNIRLQTIQGYNYARYGNIYEYTVRRIEKESYFIAAGYISPSHNANNGECTLFIYCIKLNLTNKKSCAAPIIRVMLYPAAPTVLSINITTAAAAAAEYREGQTFNAIYSSALLKYEFERIAFVVVRALMRCVIDGRSRREEGRFVGSARRPATLSSLSRNWLYSKKFILVACSTQVRRGVIKQGGCSSRYSFIMFSQSYVR